MDTAKTDLSFHSPFKSFNCIWQHFMLSLAYSLSRRKYANLCRSGQKILATFVCYSKGPVTERQALYSFGCKLNKKICLVPSIQLGIKMTKENAEPTAVRGLEQLYRYHWLGFLVLFTPVMSQPHKFSFLQMKCFWNFKCFLAWKKHFISISTTSRYETWSYMGWNHASREAACSRAYLMTPYNPGNVAEESA